MYKEYRFVDPTKAINKRKELKQTYGYDFPLYKIDLDGKQWLGIVYPEGLQPNPKRRR
jgi:hypothetical protein